ncbi:MAG: DUF4760 domain-containing protein [Clostridia bacterium]|nr:DUF4760 domain-containing protein [Clostridia bacterium]
MEAINIISLILAIVSIGFSILTYVLSVLHEKKKATLDAYNILQEQALDTINRYQPKDIKDISGDVKSQEYKKISTILARIEHFCVGVNSRIYDKKTVKLLAGRYLVSLYGKLKPMIMKKREINTFDKHYNEFEKLAEELEKMYKGKNKKSTAI